MAVTEQSGLEFERYFTRDLKGTDVYDSFEWSKSDVDIVDDDNNYLFTQKDVEFPTAYSPTAKKIVASKYFFGEQDTPQREHSARQLIGRVSSTFSEWGLKQGYFTEEEADAFREELAYLSLDQRMAFNSPVWFNVGIDKIAGAGSDEQKEAYIIDDNGQVQRMPIGMDRTYPQTSACFIQHVDDTMEGIMDLAKTEALLFKYGSGTGTNLSTLRSSREKLSGGGKPSGPLAYWAFYDKVAGIVKSGGKTRRAAKMDQLNMSHPDIWEFIESKRREEEKLHILIDNGVHWKEANETVNYQNTNISVRIPDSFMQAVENDEEWQTVPVHNKEMIDQMPKYKAKKLLRRLAENAHFCGCPGVQFDDSINKWNTVPNFARINCSNPCAEYNNPDDSSCNLASHNLIKYLIENDTFDTEGFSNATRTTAIAQDLEFDNSSYPTSKIAENSHRLRPLGQGYTNLGSLLMYLGLPYDSDEARATAAAITALQTGVVYETSTELAEKLGPFEEFENNKEAMLNVMGMHRAALDNIDKSKIPKGLENILDNAYKAWDNVVERGKLYGFRNNQATVLAPCGTIGLYMDSDTKGVEPEIGLIQTKLLSDGGLLRLVNSTVKPALERLGYNEGQVVDITQYIGGYGDVEGAPNLRIEHREQIKDKNPKGKREELENLGYSKTQIDDIVFYIDGHEIIEGAPHIRDEHLAIFDCANKPSHGTRTISYKGHLGMMTAVQPFLSGAISKTVNLPEETSVEEIEAIYSDAWKMGLKGVALYRDNSKRIQPLSFSGQGDGYKPIRRKLPNTRNGRIHKFDIVDHEGYTIIGEYPDGSPGELFINMSKEGSTIGGLMDGIGILTSMGLQYGVPLEALVKKFRHQKFEPHGLVREGHPEIHEADSIMDYIFHYLEKEYLKNGDVDENEENRNNSLQEIQESGNGPLSEAEKGGLCAICGSQMIKKGDCLEACTECGYEDPSGCGQ